MGKHFYGTHKDKREAAAISLELARNFGACYTPTLESDCSLNPHTGLWTCMTRAHQRRGSCGSAEVLRGTHATPAQLGWAWRHHPNELKSQDDKQNFVESLDEEVTDSQNSEEYEDASPEDYIIKD